MIDNEEIITPVTILPNVIELAYYSNCLVQHFVMQSVIAVAINSVESNGFISQDDLLKNSLEICDILQYEFLFCKPCQNLETVISITIDDLVLKEILILHANVESKMSQRLKEELFDDDIDEEVQRVPDYEVIKTEKNLQYLKFLRNILNQWLEPYSLTAFCLDKIVDTEVLEQDYVKDVLEEMKEQFQRGEIKYGIIFRYSFNNVLIQLFFFTRRECIGGCDKERTEITTTLGRFRLSR